MTFKVTKAFLTLSVSLLELNALYQIKYSLYDTFYISLILTNKKNTTHDLS